MDVHPCILIYSVSGGGGGVGGGGMVVPVLPEAMGRHTMTGFSDLSQNM